MKYTAFSKIKTFLETTDYVCHRIVINYEEKTTDEITLTWKQHKIMKNDKNNTCNIADALHCRCLTIGETFSDAQLAGFTSEWGQRKCDRHIWQTMKAKSSLIKKALSFTLIICTSLS